MNSNKKEKIKRFFFPHIKVRDYIYSFFVNLRLFPISIAIKMPIYFRRDVKINRCYRGCIEFTDSIRRGMVKIGFPGAANAGIENTFFYCDDKSKIFFGDHVTIARGGKVIITNGGELHIGRNTFINANVSMQSESKIQIGEDCFVGWNSKIRDTDGHNIFVNGELKERTKPVSVGNHVWITADVTILKGSNIADGSVVACNSLVCGIKNDEKNSLIGGSPARVLKQNVTWDE